MKKNKYALVFSVSILVISIVVGIIYGLNNKYNMTDYVNSLDKNLLLINHLIVIAIFLFSTISLLGVIVNSFYIGFEGVSIGYIVVSFFNTYGIKGIIYSIINVLINKGLFLLIIFYLFIVDLKYTKKCLSNLVGINTDYLVSLIKPLLKKYLTIIVFIIVVDVLNYFFAYKILKYFTFML